jgi:hypothetical protein
LYPEFFVAYDPHLPHCMPSLVVYSSYKYYCIESF